MLVAMGEIYANLTTLNLTLPNLMEICLIIT